MKHWIHPQELLENLKEDCAKGLDTSPPQWREELKAIKKANTYRALIEALLYYGWTRTSVLEQVIETATRTKVSLQDLLE